MHLGKWTALLSVFWLLLSGYIQPLLLTFGVISVAIVLIVLKRMDDVDEDPKHISSGVKMLKYIPWLLGQVVQSSMHVTKLVWGSSDKVSPALAKVDVTNIPLSNRVLYANSITLTPGTLSVDLEHGEITVHALQQSSIDDLKKGDMEKKITGIWGENK